MGHLLSCAPLDERLAPVSRPGPDQALVVSLRGEVFVQREGGWKALLPGDLVYANEWIRVTARSTAVLQAGGGLILSLQEETLVRLDSLEWSSQELRAEALLEWGTIVSRVRTKGGTAQVRIRSGVVSAGVRGTDFLVRRSDQDVLVAVGSGSVALRSGEEEVELNEGFEAALPVNTPQRPIPQPLGGVSRERLAQASGLEFLPLDEETLRLVRFLVRTVPPDADIVMGDRIMGRGIWGGVLKEGNELSLVVRKGGYRSQEVVVRALPGENPVTVVTLEPLDPNEGPGTHPQAPSQEDLLRAQEAALAALRQRSEELERELQDRGGRLQELNQRLNALSAEAAELNARLNRALQERQALQTQIQALTQERDQRQRELEAARRELAAIRAQLNAVIEAREAEQKATNELIRQLREHRSQ